MDKRFETNQYIPDCRVIPAFLIARRPSKLTSTNQMLARGEGTHSFFFEKLFMWHGNDAVR
jgi:hypothetical protein